jgi:hypothetical protein
MKEHKIIVSAAFKSECYGCIGAEEKIQPFLDNGWEIEKLECTGKAHYDATVVAYLTREIPERSRCENCGSTEGIRSTVYGKKLCKDCMEDYKKNMKLLANGEYDKLFNET